MTIWRRVVDHLFTVAGNRDDQAPGLEREAGQTGGLLPANSLLSDASLARLTTPGPRSAPRQTALAPREELNAILAAKVLRAWAENRTQTLQPLVLNLGLLTPEQAELLVTLAAALSRLCARGEIEAGSRARAALRAARASAEQIARFEGALVSGGDVSVLIGEAQRAGLSGHCFAMAAAVLESQDPVARACLAFLRLRLDIPAEVANSLARRYRR